MSVTQLNASQLYHGCNPADLPFKTTATVEPLTGLIGQDRAREAIEFAANIQADGYNLYVMGRPAWVKNHWSANISPNTVQIGLMQKIGLI